MKVRSIALSLVALVAALLSTANAQFVFKDNISSDGYKKAVDKMIDEVFAKWAQMNSDLSEDVLSEVANGLQAVAIPHYVGVSNAPKEQTVTLKLTRDKFCDLRVEYKGVLLGEAIMTDKGKFETTAYLTKDIATASAIPHEATDSASIIKKFAKEHNAFSVYGISMDNMLFYEKDGKYYHYNMEDFTEAPFSISEAKNNKVPVGQDDDGKPKPIAIVCSAVGGALCLFILILTLV